MRAEPGPPPGARLSQLDIARIPLTRPRWEVLSAPEAHEAVLGALKKAGIETESAEVGMIPKNLVKVEGKNAAAMIRLSEYLEEHDDVQSVYSNFDAETSLRGLGPSHLQQARLRDRATRGQLGRLPER